MNSHQLQDFSVPEEGDLVAVDVEGTAVAVTVANGELHAFDDTCTHAGCSLADGKLDGHIVVCPCHLSRFDVRTGAVLSGPAPCGVTPWSATLEEETLRLEVRGPPEGQGDVAAYLGSPGSASAGTDLDIAAIIEREHAAFRRQFDALAGIAGHRELEKAWGQLAELLEVHASGEEAVLYPNVVQVAEDGIEETDDAVRDHNEIRNSVRGVREHPVGSDAWWAAIRAAQDVNEEHLQEEERDVLPTLRRTVDTARRTELGQQWLDFYDAHKEGRGLSGRDTDPQDVVQQQPT